MLTNDEIIKYRLESLKISYEVNHKIGILKDLYEKDNNQIRDNLKDIFDLAEMNYDYIVNGIHPNFNEEEEAGY